LAASGGDRVVVVEYEYLGLFESETTVEMVETLPYAHVAEHKMFVPILLYVLLYVLGGGFGGVP